MVGNLGLGFRSKVIQKNAGSLGEDNFAYLLIQTGKFFKCVVCTYLMQYRRQGLCEGNIF